MRAETIQFLRDILIGPAIVGLSVGYALVIVGRNNTNKQIQSDAIRDLMAYRGDYSSADFRRALNKVSIVFHRDGDIRKEIRELYEAVNNSTGKELTDRKIVSLIYNLCQKNGYKQITEYDIDQSFPETNQRPTGEDTPQSIPLPVTTSSQNTTVNTPPTP